MCRGPHQISNAESFDIGLSNLGGVCFQRLNLSIQCLLNIHKHRRGKILGRRAFVKQHVFGVSRGGNRAHGQMPVILMGIIMIMNKDEMCLNLSHNFLNCLNQFSSEWGLGIVISTPKYFLSLEQFR